MHNIPKSRIPYSIYNGHSKDTGLPYFELVKIYINAIISINISMQWRNTRVKLQNLPWYKTGLVSRQVLHLVSKLQNWICPKTGQYKTCIVPNIKTQASIWATKPKPWESHITSETVEILIQNEKAGLASMQSRFWCGRFRVGAKPVLVWQV